jgi:hypothetical protein
VLVDDWLEERKRHVDVITTAHDRDEAEALGLQLAEYMCPCIALKAKAERRPSGAQ